MILNMFMAGFPLDLSKRQHCLISFQVFELLDLSSTCLVNDSRHIIQLHMLLQILDRYMSLNQIRIRFLIDLLFHVLEIDNKFFVLYCFRFSYF